MKEIVIGLCFLLIGLLVGYGIGFGSAINWGINKAAYMLEIRGFNMTTLTLDVDLDQIIYGIMQYKENINTCYPDRQNAFTLNNTWNKT